MRLPALYLYGGLGGRLSHTLANLQVLRFLADQGAWGALVDGGSIITVFARGRLSFAPGCTGMLSLFACGGAAEGVSIRGMKYNAECISLLPDYPLGTSNAFTAEAGEKSLWKQERWLLFGSTRRRTSAR